MNKKRQVQDFACTTSQPLTALELIQFCRVPAKATRDAEVCGLRKPKTKKKKAAGTATPVRIRDRPIVPGQRLIFKKQVLELLGLRSYSTLWSWMKQGTFPLPLELGPPNVRSSAIAWDAHEVFAWIATRPRRQFGQYEFRGLGATAEPTPPATPRDAATALAAVLGKPAAPPLKQPYAAKVVRRRPQERAR